MRHRTASSVCFLMNANLWPECPHSNICYLNGQEFTSSSHFVSCPWQGFEIKICLSIQKDPTSCTLAVFYGSCNPTNLEINLCLSCQKPDILIEKHMNGKFRILLSKQALLTGGLFLYCRPTLHLTYICRKPVFRTMAQDQLSVFLLCKH